MPDWNEVSDLPFEAQVPIYKSHLAEHPNDAAIWFDLGLAHKYLLQWKESADANERALSLSAEPGDPAWWNLGIAATALRDWKRARNAWRGYGIEIAGDDGPVSCDFGMAPVRLPHGEVVWGERIDPARVVVRNVPLPDSEYRWGDVLLHDGAPNGERIVNGTTYGVFDVLEKWSPSEIPTLQVNVVCPTNEDSRALIDLFDANKFAAEDWTANVRNLCQACSTGNPDGHNHNFGTDNSERHFGIASPVGLAEQLLARWANSNGRAFSDLRAV
jgi:tetratricopeptide (TPR) repeat protein